MKTNCISAVKKNTIYRKKFEFPCGKMLTVLVSLSWTELAVTDIDADVQ